MFITKCKVVTKNEAEESYHIFYKKYKDNKNSISYILTEDTIQNKFARELNADKEFFLLFAKEMDYEPIAISFNGEFFHPAKPLSSGEPTQKQKRYLEIVNNDFKMTFFSFLDLSSILSDDSNTFKYSVYNWLLSIFATAAIYQEDFSSSSSGLTCALIIMFILSIITTQVRLWSNKLYLQRNKSKMEKHQRPIMISQKENDIKLSDIACLLKHNKKEPDNKQQVIIDEFLNKKLENNPTKIVQLQHEFYDKHLSSDKIYKVLERL